MKSPCCEGFYAHLKSEIKKHIVNKNVFEGRFYYYQCEKCNEKWTSTESDTISMDNFKHRKL